MSPASAGGKRRAQGANVIGPEPAASPDHLAALLDPLAGALDEFVGGGSVPDRRILASVDVVVPVGVRVDADGPRPLLLDDRHARSGGLDRRVEDADQQSAQWYDRVEALGQVAGG